MKVIDLLNKIANGKEVPKKIKWGVHEFRWFVYEYKSIGELSEPTLLDYLSQAPQMVNDEIEIIEEPKKIEKLDIKCDGTTSNNFYILNKNGIKCYMTKHSKVIVEKLNEIIDYINNMEE